MSDAVSQYLDAQPLDYSQLSDEQVDAKIERLEQLAYSGDWAASQLDALDAPTLRDVFWFLQDGIDSVLQDGDADQGGIDSSLELQDAVRAALARELDPSSPAASKIPVIYIQSSAPDTDIERICLYTTAPAPGTRLVITVEADGSASHEYQPIGG